MPPLPRSNALSRCQPPPSASKRVRVANRCDRPTDRAGPAPLIDDALNVPTTRPRVFRGVQGIALPSAPSLPPRLVGGCAPDPEHRFKAARRRAGPQRQGERSELHMMLASSRSADPATAVAARCPPALDRSLSSKGIPCLNHSLGPTHGSFSALLRSTPISRRPRRLLLGTVLTGLAGSSRRHEPHPSRGSRSTTPIIVHRTVNRRRPPVAAPDDAPRADQPLSGTRPR